MSQEIPGRTKIETRKTSHVHTTDPAHSINNADDRKVKENINSDINFDFEENSPFREGVISKTFQRPDKSFFQEPKELGNLINKGNLVHKYLPKQKEIDKILEIIQRKELKGTHLPI